MSFEKDREGGITLDASVALAWCFEDEWSAQADEVLRLVQSDGALVPPLWDLEIVNVLLVAERRGRITPADTIRFLALFDALPIEISESDPPMTELAAIGRTHGLSAYDSAYLLASLRSGWPLATLDERLREAAKAIGCALVLG